MGTLSACPHAPIAFAARRVGRASTRLQIKTPCRSSRDVTAWTAIDYGLYRLRDVFGLIADVKSVGCTAYPLPEILLFPIWSRLPTSAMPA